MGRKGWCLELQLGLAFLAGFVMTSGWILLTAGPASAVTCVDVLNTTDEAGANGRGNRAENPGMHIYNDTIECGRASSLFVKNATETKFVEVGWFEDPVGGLFDYNCLGETTGPPRLFAFVDTGASRSCSWGMELSVGDDGFTLKDPDQNGRWTFGHAGSNFYISPDLGSFNSGLLRTNGERGGNGNEPARSEFAGLDRMDDANNWSAWQNPFEAWTSDDPGFHDCIDNGHHIRVINDSNTC